MDINGNLLKILCCPKCKGDLKLKNNFIYCKECNHKYEIKDGIPILIINKDV